MSEIGEPRRVRAQPRQAAEGVRKSRPSPEGRKRLAPDEREQQIVAQAIAFFATHGFEGHTRDLAKQMGITQPLLYRYFPNKEALIERVYQEVFLGHWNTQWTQWIDDEKTPLKQRLTAFYEDYAKIILSYEWVRLFMFAGLKGLDFNARYLGVLRERIFLPVIDQLRRAYGRPSIDGLPATEDELEIIWGLHASIFYLGVREHIYHLPVPSDLGKAIATKIDSFLGGIEPVLADARQAKPRSQRAPSK